MLVGGSLQGTNLLVLVRSGAFHGSSQPTGRFEGWVTTSGGTSSDPNTQGCYNNLRINLHPNVNPPFGGIYWLATPEQRTLKDYTANMTAKGLIREHAFCAASPI